MYRKKNEASNRKPSGKSSGSSTSVRVQLNKLNDKEISDQNMASVLGDTTSSAKTSLRVSPLYDKRRTVEVPANELRGKGPDKIETTSDSSGRTNHHSNGSANNISQDTEMRDRTTSPRVENEHPIVYDANFQLKNHQARHAQHIQRKNEAAVQKERDLGRVLPARVQRDSQSRSYFPPTIPSSSPFMTPRQSLHGDARVTVPEPAAAPVATVVTKTEVEHVLRRARIRRWWRCVLVVTLASLLFALVLVVVLVLILR